MKLSTLKQHLSAMTAVNFVLPDGTTVPPHFHVTEAGVVTKHFIDCGSTVRAEKVLNFQVWVAQDTDHRLSPEKLLKIITVSENLFGNEDLDIEVEYQGTTIGKYGLDFANGSLVLTAKQTDCLAKDNCGVPQEKQAEKEVVAAGCCAPGGVCC